MKSYKKYLLW